MNFPANMDRAVEAATLLRDLDSAAFRDRYACDRFTASILGNRFRYVMTHMATKLQTNAFSRIIREANDFCTTISGPPEIGWPMPAASLTNPVHWGPVADSVPIVLEEYGLDRLRAGDIIIANDSYRTGKHLNDTSFIKPIFWDGRLAGAVHVTAHQLDLGSRTPGGFDIGSQSLWEDGLVLPPILLYAAGVPERSTFRLIAANTRYPDVILADLQVIRASLDLGENLLIESIERYGIEAFLGAIRYSCDAAAETMGQAIRALPNGEYFGSHLIDGDGLAGSPEYVVAVRINKQGEHLEFDFSGTSAASRTAVNCSWLDVKTGVLVALKLLLDRRSTPNSGAMRNIDILLPPGSMLNPEPPAATMFYFSMVQAVIRATIEAFNSLMEEKALASDSDSSAIHHVHGKTAEGEPWISFGAAPLTYSSGATDAGDADTSTLLSWMNFPTSGCEVDEYDQPALIMRSEAAIDTGGAGYNRGGTGQMVDVYYPHAGFHHHSTSQVKRAPIGACGGGASQAGGDWLFDPQSSELSRKGWLPGELRGPMYEEATPLAGVLDPETHELSPAGEYVFLDHEVYGSPGSVTRAISNGGGGWGNPYSREADRVLRDVRDGYVSIGGAAQDYGVAIEGDPERDPEKLRVNEAATRALRANAMQMAASSSESL